MDYVTKQFCAGRRSRAGGFTLIELMVVVAIVAILASIAVPAYNEQVRKTRRTTATGELMSIAQQLERFNTANGGTYVQTAGDPTATPPTADSNALCTKTLDFYTISCQTLTRTTFEIRAAPRSDQTNDRCGTFTLNQAGLKGLVGAQSGLTARDCW